MAQFKCVKTSKTIILQIFPDLICPAAQFIQLLSVFITSATISIIGAERCVLFYFAF